MQSDNRFSSASKVSVDALVNYVYDDNENDLHSRLNFLIQGSEYDFQRGNAWYELSIEKGWAEYNSRIKAGRFERSDHLGFYFLDGLNLNYQKSQDDLGFELYMGRPGRIDHVQSIEGDYLFGVELYGQQKNITKNLLLSHIVDSLDFRFGLQKIKNVTTAHRINLAVNTQGKANKPVKDSHCHFDCQRFKSQLLLSYHAEENKVEDLFFDVRIPVNQDLRLRLAYEHYRPEVVLNPGFREQFYSFYAFGEQKISEMNVDYFFNNQVSGFIKRLHSNREIGNDGMGYAAGIKIKKPFSHKVDADLSLSVDSVELGDNQLDSFYLSLKHHLNSRLNVQLDGIYREEEKNLLGQNSVFGLNVKINYMLKNNLILFFEAREIKNSRLRNEHLVRLNMTYYFDNFKAMRSDPKLNKQRY